MARIYGLKLQGMEEFFLNLDAIVSIGVGQVTDGETTAKATVVHLMSGKNLVFNPDLYHDILQAWKGGDERDLDVPDAFFNAFKDQKGDDKEPA